MAYVVHVEEALDLGQQALQLPLDDGRLVLAGAPNMRDEDVIVVPLLERESRLPAAAQPQRGGGGLLEGAVHDHAHDDGKEDEVAHDAPNRGLQRRAEAKSLAQ